MSDAKYVSDVPNLLSEWNNELNAGLSPDEITLSNKRRKIRWVCSNCGSIWTASAYSRYHSEMGCPECDPKTNSIKYRQPRFSPERSLGALYPDIAAEWHPTLNGHLLPTEIAPYYSNKVWWKCSTCGSDYLLSPSKRISNNQGCKQCALKRRSEKMRLKKLTPGTNDLASQRPDLLKEWDYEKNADICSPNEITTGSNFYVHWKCQTCGHEWQATVYNRIYRGSGCANCANARSGQKQRLSGLKKGINDVASQCPSLLKEWDYEQNADICSPDEITVGSSIAVHWICSICGYKWQATPYSRIHKGTGCRKCAILSQRLKRSLG